MNEATKRVKLNITMETDLCSSPGDFYEAQDWVEWVMPLLKKQAECYNPDVTAKVEGTPEVTWIDPPGGHHYGYPKILPEGVRNVRRWLLSNGYPAGEIANGGMRYRTWKAPMPTSWLEEEND